MDYYTPMRMSKLKLYIIIWVHLVHIMLNQRGQTQDHIGMIPFI